MNDSNQATSSRDAETSVYLRHMSRRSLGEVVLIDRPGLLQKRLAEDLFSRGYDVRVFSSAQEGLTRTEAADPPDLAIVGADLPDGSGLELVARFRRGLESFPILVLCDGMEEAYLRSYAAGASDCVARSVACAVLLAKCMNLIARCAPARDEAPPRLVSGSVLFGRYRLLEPLGEGAYGEVFAAEDLQQSRTVALKVMLPGSTAESRERFLREVYSLSSVESPEVVKVFDFGKRSGLLYCAMEHVQGPSLCDAVWRRGRFREHELRGLLVGLIRGLAALERVGLLHRDIKPSNIMLRNGDPADPVLIDFGLAKRPFDAGVTCPDIMMGSPGYIAPEVLDGPGDHRSDLFATGQVIGFAARGGEAYPSLEGFDLVCQMARAQVPLPSGSPELLQVLDKLTRLDPESRYSSATQLLRRLNQLGVSPWEREEFDDPDRSRRRSHSPTR